MGEEEDGRRRRGREAPPGPPEGAPGPCEGGAGRAPPAAQPLLPSAARGERLGPAAAPASASSPSVPCLLPPPGGREGARPKGAAGREV